MGSDFVDFSVTLPAGDSDDMDDLSVLDAGFLEAEDADRHISLAIGAMAIIDGPAEPQDVLQRELESRLVTFPRYNEVVRRHPLDLRSPRWEPDPRFDIGRHLHRVALPAPGDDSALFTLAAELMAARLDRDRPLWECWVIEGLQDNRWAVLVKMHHCIADGIAATQNLIKLFDDGGGTTYADQIHGTKSDIKTGKGFGFLTNPVGLVRSGWATSVRLPRRLTRAAGGALQIASGIVRPSTSSLVGRLGTSRRYSAVTVSLTDVQTVCDRFGVTVNDVALAGITHGFRAVLLGRDEHPEGGGVRTLVPVSIRRIEALQQTDNRVSLMLADLPVEVGDPLERLECIHRQLDRTKHSGQTQAGALLLEMVRFLPFTLSAWAVRLLTALPQRGVVTLTTNIPGPRQTHSLLGHPVRHLLPVPPIALGLLTGVAVLTYADELVFGINADWDGTPDLDRLSTAIAEGMAQLVSISRHPVTRLQSGTRN